jgi:ribosomal protein L10
MTKKTMAIYKTKNFFNTYPLMLFVQHNNLSVKEWSGLRMEIKQLDSVNMLILKNSIVENITFNPNMIDKNIIESLFQGPCLAIGCLELSQFRKITKIFQVTPKVLIIAAVLNKQLLTHLDLDKLLTLNTNIYNSLINEMSQSMNLCNIIQSPLNFQILDQIPKNLINCLYYIKNTKQ